VSDVRHEFKSKTISTLSTYVLATGVERSIWKNPRPSANKAKAHLHVSCIVYSVLSSFGTLAGVIVLRLIPPTLICW